MEQPNLLSVDSLLQNYELKEKDCTTQVSDDFLEIFCRSHCKMWRSMPSQLGMKSIAANDIDRESKPEEEKRLNFFQRWKQERGSDATYMNLINALLKLEYRQDAESVCKLLKKSLSKDSPLKKQSSENTSLKQSVVPDSGVLEDLEQQLEINLKHIMNRYASYVRTVRLSIKNKGITATELCSYVMALPAFNSGEQKAILLSGSREELEKATSIEQIFNILVHKYTSFLNYDIFQSMLDEYGIDQDTDKLNYPEYLKQYAERHKLKEFAEINPLLETFRDASKEVILKIDIESTCSLAKLIDLQKSFSNILGINKRALRILDVKDGCVQVTFLIPAHIADVIFTSEKKFTLEEVKELQILSIVWLQCNGLEYKFGEDFDFDQIRPQGITKISAALVSGDFNAALPLIKSMSFHNSEELCRALPENRTPLHYACQYGQVDRAKQLITSFHYSLDSKDANGCTALYVAAQYGQTEMIKYLLSVIYEEKASILDFDLERMCVIYQHAISETHCDFSGNTPLHTACTHGQLDIVQLFTSEIGCDPNHTNSEGLSCLHLAAQHGHLSLVKYLIEEAEYDVTLEENHQHVRSLSYLAAGGGHLHILKYLIEGKGADPHFKTSKEWNSPEYVTYQGTSLVHIAAIEGQLDVVRYLVERHGCNPSWKDSKGFTPLYLACEGGDLDVIKYLISENNCDPHCFSNDGKTCIHAAISGNNLEVVKYLTTEHNFDTLLDTDGNTSLHYAGLYGRLDILRYLIEDAECSLDSINSEDVSPLHLASKNGHLDVVKYLVNQCHCDPQQADSTLHTPLLLAAGNGHLDVVKFFIHDAKCDPNSAYKDGITLLHYASNTGQLSIVKYLIEVCHCDPMSSDIHRKTPLDHAAANNKFEVVDYLLTYDDNLQEAPMFYAAYSELEINDLSAKLFIGDETTDMREEEFNIEILTWQY